LGGGDGRVDGESGDDRGEWQGGEFLGDGRQAEGINLWDTKGLVSLPHERTVAAPVYQATMANLGPSRLKSSPALRLAK
jgi:hypothetical protein